MQSICSLIDELNSNRIETREFNNTFNTELLGVKEEMFDEDFDSRAFNELMQISESDFSISLLDGLSNVLELMNFGYSMDAAMISLGLNSEERLLTMLRYARLCYSEENFNLGDYYVRFVESIKNKSNDIKMLLNEVRTNKMFYKNQKNSQEYYTIKLLRGMN